MKKNINFICIALLMFFIVGGCDIDFGTNDDGGGGGGGSNNDEVVQGTIVEVLPTRASGVANINVVIIDDDSLIEFTDTTTNSGFFSIEGNFFGTSGTIEIEFRDADDMDVVLAQSFLDIFPGAELNLVNVSIENGTVNFDPDNPDINFEADITENNCIDDTGSIIVLIENGNDDIEVIVQITPSTDIIRDSEDITCNDFLIGQTLNINGTLISSNTVNAESIEVL
ncbi:MAG: hypothetical protein ACR2NW_01435 [Thermodesulfobacteriota bacterium]